MTAPGLLTSKIIGQKSRYAHSVSSRSSVTEIVRQPYLEAQTESIVFAIQSVLSAVRSPTPPTTLNENLTQIITIVSSIVAVCNDTLPPGSSQQGNEYLKELVEHANKLSEVQSLPEVTKESRQVMAKSSFAIANAMKGLNKLG
jgi:protein SPA2